MKKNDLFYIFLKREKNDKIKLMSKNINSKRCKQWFKYFIDSVNNNNKYKTELKNQVDIDIINCMTPYLKKFNGKDIYLFIFSICGQEFNKLYFINNIIDNNIDLTTYLNEIKQHISLFNKKIISENEKKQLISKLNKIYQEQIKEGMEFMPYPKKVLLNDSLFINNIDKYVQQFNKYKFNSIGLLLSLKEVINDDSQHLGLNIQYVINKLPDNIKDIISNNTIEYSSLNYVEQYNQSISFLEQLEYNLLCFKLANNLIILNKLKVILSYKNDRLFFNTFGQSIINKIYNKIKPNFISNIDDHFIRYSTYFIMDSIYAFLCGYHKAIFGVIPIIETIYKKAYCIPDNHKNAKFISNIPELYNNEMIRNIFLKPSQLIENKEDPIKYCLNIKNDFFHYKFKDDELMEYMAMYVFEFLMKEFVF
jgi:hypothetical protein